MATVKGEYSFPFSTAILIDGGFFLKRYFRCYDNSHNHNAQQVVKNLYEIVKKHLDGGYLYRIFYYDCLPLDKRIQNPVTKKGIELGKTSEAIFRNGLFDELRKSRKVAIRYGYLVDNQEWNLKPERFKELISQKITINELKEKDAVYSMRQKGIDITIGIDIATLSYKKLVHRIVLITGDSDFVPAAKLARREGIDFILDPMWAYIRPDLSEHVDGLVSKCPKPKPRLLDSN
jgi:uncharacterized LabA/DUF88 family protein